LLSHFVHQKRSVFYGATQQSERVELGRLTEAVSRDLGDEVADLAGGGFVGWEAALRYFAALARTEPIVVVLDEVPYLARSTKGFASIVQAVWDHLASNTKLMLVLTGSAVGVIEDMLGAHGALRGRSTLQLRLDPVDLVSAQAFLPQLDPTSYFEAYAACGGYPMHLLSWDQSVDTRTNLERLAATAGGLLLEDAAGILYEELPETGGYQRILAAVGRGHTRASNIASEADQRIEAPLEVLVRAGFVRRSNPLGAPRRSRPLYEIPDPYLAFWFGVLYSDAAYVAGGQGRAVLRRRQPQWERHLGWVFEEAAREHAAHLVDNGELPADTVIGRWWATSGPECEIDVLGMRGSQTVMLGEAKWRQAPVGYRELTTLVARASRTPSPAEDMVYALWSKNGGEASVQAPNVRSFDLRDVLRLKR